MKKLNYVVNTEFSRKIWGDLIRVVTGMTSFELAKLFKVTPAYISNFESGGVFSNNLCLCYDRLINLFHLDKFLDWYNSSRDFPTDLYSLVYTINNLDSSYATKKYVDSFISKRDWGTLIRILLGFDLSDFADVLGVFKSGLCNFEAGRNNQVYLFGVYNYFIEALGIIDLGSWVKSCQDLVKSGVISLDVEFNSDDWGE